MSHFKLILQCFTVFILISSIQVDSTTSLRQLHVFFRHGERTPTETYKNDPYINFTWSGGWGHLTNNGKLQMYKLGIKLRDLYKDFIPEYYFHEDVEVLSSYSDRCLMSAELLLAGLFPPKNLQIWNRDLLWQPIAVKYVPRSQDTLIAMKRKCKKYDDEFINVMNSEEIEEINRENLDLYDTLTSNTGELIDNINSLEFLYNTLEIELLHNLTLPSWTKNVSLPHMKDLAAKSLATFTHTDYMKRMKGGVFLNKTISNMKNNKTPILYLYSGHDISIVNILRTLGVEYLLKPGFGASLIMELHNNAEVKMFYRDEFDDEPEELFLPSCNSPCLISDFESILKPFLPIDWEKECKN